MTYTPVCGVDELVDDRPLAVEVGDLELALVRHEGAVYAIYDECSHAKVPLSDGDVDDCTIECYLHGSRFDLRTGRAVSLPATAPVPVYPVMIQGAEVLVDIDNPLTMNETSPSADAPHVMATSPASASPIRTSQES